MTIKYYKNKFLILIVTPFIFASLSCKKQSAVNQEKQISETLDKWHKAVADYNYNEYFSYFADDAVFIGTDASENWKLNEFKDFCKPYFKKKKTWNFKPLDRNIYVNNNFAWFDELLDTQMGVCRGSGVLVKQNSGWKIKHYVLSIAIPNENVSEVVKIKRVKDSVIINSLNNKN